ncbi:MAG: M56 family metallopeptidase [Chitinophagaceae bacterium]|nr:M56 family metallopeptidase [Chitinophagaceae bacterium]
MAASFQYISIVYLALLLLHGFKFAKHFRAIYQVKNSPFIKAPIDTRLFTEQIALHIGIHKKVSIWLSEKVDVPSVIGFFKPMILLPVTALNNLTTAQAEAIILHELAHIKRNDYLINLLQSFIELILFFNPFARLLGNTARIERENCCDDWVLNYRYNKHDYASALLLLEQNRSLSLKLALAATNGKKNLLGRIKRLFAAEPQTSMGFGNRIKLATTAFTLLLGIFFALPVIGKKGNPAAQKQAVDLVAASSFASLKMPVDNYSEMNTAAIINKKPVTDQQVISKAVLAKKIVAKQLHLNEQEYTLALVNEELLKLDDQLQEVAVQVSDNEAKASPTLMVKVEEEQSGVKDKKTYLLELKNNNGVAEIKPLVLLTKKMRILTEKIKPASKVQLPDTLKTTIKKRITS